MKPAAIPPKNPAGDTACACTLTCKPLVPLTMAAMYPPTNPGIKAGKSPIDSAI